MRRSSISRGYSSNKKLGLVPLAAVIFFTVSGGPFGIEPLLGYAGHWSLLLLAVVPILWDIPSILMVMELNSLMPVSGGYYQWVKKALGLRWAFYEGWWTWLYTFVDLAIYPVFFVEYAAFFFPDIVQYKIPLCLAMVWVNAGINILGIRSVGRSALLLTAVVILPFCFLIVSGFLHGSTAGVSAHSPDRATFGLALYTIMWNYIGWDNATTYAGEVNRPVKSYFISTLLAFGCIYALYLLSAYTAMHSGLSFDDISEQGFPYVAAHLGGRWLGAVFSACGMASMLGIFSAVLLSVSRVPAVMSADKLLPALISKQHPRYQTPYISIILCAGVVSILILRNIADLLVMDITLYGAGLSLEFLSLIVLRIQLPGAIRPFKIPLTLPWLIVLCCLPLVVFAVALAGVLTGPGPGFQPAVFALAALVSAEAGWQLVQWRRKSGSLVKKEL
ncbi:MAG: APC family permease [Chitinophagaceae bacterium]|nr:APC family permease [Chitinophagaceae bacterium]